MAFNYQNAATAALVRPEVCVDPGPVNVRDGRVATSGGVTAALDLTLAFVEEDNGTELARRVALGNGRYLHRLAETLAGRLPAWRAWRGTHVQAPVTCPQPRRWPASPEAIRAVADDLANRLRDSDGRTREAPQAPTIPPTTSHR